MFEHVKASAIPMIFKSLAASSVSDSVACQDDRFLEMTARQKIATGNPSYNRFTLQCSNGCRPLHGLTTASPGRPSPARTAGTESLTASDSPARPKSPAARPACPAGPSHDMTGTTVDRTHDLLLANDIPDTISRLIERHCIIVKMIMRRHHGNRTPNVRLSVSGHSETVSSRA